MYKFYEGTQEHQIRQTQLVSKINQKLYSIIIIRGPQSVLNAKQISAVANVWLIKLPILYILFHLFLVSANSFMTLILRLRQALIQVIQALSERLQKLNPSRVLALRMITRS